MDLSVVILNFNTAALLHNCLASLRETAGIKMQVIVVDNDSGDDSVAMVKAEFPEVKLIESKENLGFSRGNNLAVPSLEGRYILFLNSDTVVPAKTLSYLVDFMDGQEACGIISPRVDLKIGGLDKDCHRGFPTPWNSLAHFTRLNQLFPKSRFLNGYYQGYQDLNTVHEVDSVSGAFLLVRKKIADQVGYWDPDFFFYGEDLDFCYRVKKAGWKVVYNPNVHVVHYKGASSGFKKESQAFTKAELATKKRVARESVRAMRLFYQKHYLSVYPRPLNWLVLQALRLLEWKRTGQYG